MSIRPLLVVAVAALAATPLLLPEAPAGLVGDGRADETAALQRAVDAGSVRLPKGVYRLTRSVVVNLDKVGPVAVTADGTARLVMAGPGPALKFVGTHAGTAGPSSFKPEVWERQRTPTVEGLEIVGAHPEADGIEADGTMQITLSRVVVREARHAVHLVNRNRNVLISACHFYHNRGVGVFLDNVNLHQTNIVGSHISYCGGGGVVSRGGDVRNIQIGACDIEGNMARGGPPTANVLLDSTGGSVAEVAITGCSIQHAHDAPDSANIRILGGGVGGSGARRLPATREGHVTIGDNVFSDVQVNVDIRQARGVTLTGNTFWMGYKHNLYVEDSTNVVVGPNAFDRNPRYAYGTSEQTANSVVFRNCADCTLTGLHVNEVNRAEAGVTLEDCRRFNVTNCTILDCANVGLLLKDVQNSRVSDCLIRNDRPDGAKALALKVVGGRGNLFADNLLGNPSEPATLPTRD